MKIIFKEQFLQIQKFKHLYCHNFNINSTLQYVEKLKPKKIIASTLHDFMEIYLNPSCTGYQLRGIPNFIRDTTFCEFWYQKFNQQMKVYPKQEWKPQSSFKWTNPFFPNHYEFHNLNILIDS
jgi:hypothetical protein